MSDSWKQWEGQVVDGRFPLHRYLGGSEHSAVFLTERGSQKAAIKFVQVDEPEGKLQLFRWQHAAKLSHPHLLRTFESGRCHLGGFELLYVLMELAEENLSQFLPQRPLTPAEARDVLAPALQALAFLHGEGLVHAHIRPSNILAIEDQLKLSTDGVSSIAEHSDQSVLPAAEAQPTTLEIGPRVPSPYDPPEFAKGVVSPAGDIWSLGITIIEALTQRLPAVTGPASQDRVVPDTLPALFLDIARNCLHRDPQRRWTVAEIAARLNPGSISPSASASSVAPAPPSVRAAAAGAPAIIPALAPQEPAPLSVAPARIESPARPAANPVSKPAIPPKTVAVRSTASRPRYDLVQPHLQRPPLLPPLPKLNYAPIAAVVVLVLAAIFIVPRLFRHRAPVEQAAAVEPQSPTVKPVPAVAHSKNASKSAKKSAPPVIAPAPPSSERVAQNPAPSALQKNNDKRVLAPSNPSPAATPAALEVSNPARLDSVAKPASGSVTQGEVLDQVMPTVSEKALATIRGTVRVAVKLHVDPTGNVASAELFSPGPSKYFADQALQAAHRWDFAPAKVDGHAVASDWLVHFEFTPTASRAHPTQSTP